MTMSQRIAAALASAGIQTSTITADDGDHRLTLDVRAASAIGVEATELRFEVLAVRPERTVDELKQWADRLVARVTYLMEPLVVLEVDAAGVEVEIRSSVPTARAGLRSYFEARLNSQGTLRINRLAYDPATRQRSSVPFQLTSEVLERLADDLVDTAG